MADSICTPVIWSTGHPYCTETAPIRENAITRYGIIPIDCIMPRTSDEELGRRRFQLAREQAVESAIEKIRHAPAAEWPSFSGADLTSLREILGELWIGLEREKWEGYSFSTLTRQDLRNLITLGTGAPGHALTGATLEKMDAILSHARGNPDKP
jgi:hypothetical protein